MMRLLDFRLNLHCPLSADIVGFTAISQAVEPELVMQMLHGELVQITGFPAPPKHYSIESRCGCLCTAPCPARRSIFCI